MKETNYSRCDVCNSPDISEFWSNYGSNIWVGRKTYCSATCLLIADRYKLIGMSILFVILGIFFWTIMIEYDSSGLVPLLFFISPFIIIPILLALYGFRANRHLVKVPD